MHVAIAYMRIREYVFARNRIEIAFRFVSPSLSLSIFPVAPASICNRSVAYARACICMQVPVCHCRRDRRACAIAYTNLECAVSSHGAWVSGRSQRNQSYRILLSFYFFFCSLLLSFSIHPQFCRVSPLNTNRLHLTHTFVTISFRHSYTHISAMTYQMWMWRSGVFIVRIVYFIIIIILTIFQSPCSAVLW